MTTFLPVLSDHSPRHGSRSRMTCQYRCGNACDQPVPNPTDNPTFADIATRALARRSVLKTSAAGAGALVIGGLVAEPAAAAPRARGPRRGLGRAAFAPVAPNTADKVTVASGFRDDVLIRWGDPVLRDTPAFDVNAQTEAKAKRQFGYNCDYLGVLPLRGDNFLLVSNHEYTNEELMFPTGAYDDETIKRIAMASHGLSVVKIQRRGRNGRYRVADLRNPYNRRIHTNTEFRVVGPAAGEDRLKTSADPTGRRVLGTLNNCAGGLTPWGTVLSGEENFNQYFDINGAFPEEYADSYARYGINGVNTRGWGDVDPRFEVSEEPNEPFRFGWIVEIDPYDKSSAPRKHTMLGRFKHEGANVTLADDGRVVAYMGDDQTNDYMYKFVSAGRMDRGRGKAARRRNMSLLTKGTLFVARFNDEAEDEAPEYDGTGRWIPLCSDTESFVPGMSVADVLIDTRLAADEVSPTRMDRPEDVEVNPVNGRVYAALTNNSTRGTAYPADEANPLDSSMVRASPGAPLTPASGNRNGYVLEITPRGGDHGRDRFTWQLMLVCGDPEAPETYFAGFPKRRVSPISCPDNVAFDAEGNLWVSTDGNALGSNDGFFRVPVEGPKRGQVRQLLTVPIGAETCGPFISDDQLTAFIAVQHPGESDEATFENQSSTWPDRNGYPRPSVITVHQR
jgi:secreted PhoX family phosphatase